METIIGIIAGIVIAAIIAALILRRGSGDSSAQTAALETAVSTLRADISAFENKLRDELRIEMARSRQELSLEQRETRRELTATLDVFGKRLNEHKDEVALKLVENGQATTRALSDIRDVVQQKLTDVLIAQQQQTAQLVEASKNAAELQQTEHRQSRQELSATLDAFSSRLNEHKEAVSLKLGDNGATLTRAIGEVRDTVQQKLTDMLVSQQKQTSLMTEASQKSADQLREIVEQKLEHIRTDNAAQIDKMRMTVDEKLQETLDKRLGDSFRQVSERLELVHRGLGEMQTLASGVGDLKKMLSNVKTRGTWGEVQLGAMLEQILAPEQYETNVATRGGSERVEFAIRLPGRGEEIEDIVWLPIDAKFPIEDYQRLLEAHEVGDEVAISASGKQLENRIKQCARDIHDKYIGPPSTTDFGILYLPTEGLFAEVIRRPGLCDTIQREYRVVIAGPTTLWSILNSLQMGFRTLAIQKRSSEVWKLLGAIKTDWTKYGDLLGKVQKKLQEASNTIEEAKKRTRVIGKKLKDVQELPASEASLLLPVVGADAEESDDEETGNEAT